MERKREGGRKGRGMKGGMAIRSHHTEEFYAYKPSKLPIKRANL